MTYLLDTDVLSEQTHTRPDRNVDSWIRSTSESLLYASVVSLGEIRGGIERVRLERPAQARSLEEWSQGIVEVFGPRLIDVDLSVAERWGRLTAELVATPIAIPDALIAATALVHDWTVVTRNVCHFERTGVRVLNPFER